MIVVSLGVSLSLGESRSNGPPATCDQRRDAAATRSAASSRGWGCTARPGSEVSTTQMVSLAGSAQPIVPVEPVWPKVRPEHPGLPDRSPTANPNPARGEFRRGVVLDHQPRCLGPDDSAVGSHELAQKPGEIQRGGVRSSPRRPPTSASRDCSNPTASPADRRSPTRARPLPSGTTPSLPSEPPESLSGVLHAQGLKDRLLDERNNARPADELANLRGEQDPHARVLVPGARSESERRPDRAFGELTQRRIAARSSLLLAN